MSRGPLRFTMEIPLVRESDGTVLTLDELRECIEQLARTLKGRADAAPGIQHGDMPFGDALTCGRGWCDVTETERSASN